MLRDNELKTSYVLELEAEVEQLRAALSITQRTCRGSWANGWTIYVTGYEMNAIRDALGLSKDKEEPT